MSVSKKERYKNAHELKVQRSFSKQFIQYGPKRYYGKEKDAMNELVYGERSDVTGSVGLRGIVLLQKSIWMHTMLINNDKQH